MLERVAMLLRAARHDALALGDDLGHLAVEDPHGEAGTGAKAGRCRARPSAFENALLVTGSGALALTGPVPGVAVERGEVEPDDVVDVDPRQVLLAAGDRAADAELEERQHLRQRAAALVEDDAGADGDDAQAEVGRAVRLALPDDADLGEEVVAGAASARRARSSPCGP